MWAEALSKEGVDRIGIRIQAVVAAKRGENPLRRKDQGSSDMVIRGGLAGPNMYLNRVRGMGSRLIFLRHASAMRAR